ncbi:MscL family protein, partial [Lactobacillus jensenii]
SFINSIINFLIIAFVVFLIVKSVNKLMPKPEKKPAGPTPEQEYLREIRDLLKNK